MCRFFTHPLNYLCAITPLNSSYGNNYYDNLFLCSIIKILQFFNRLLKNLRMEKSQICNNLLQKFVNGKAAELLPTAEQLQKIIETYHCKTK